MRPGAAAVSGGAEEGGDRDEHNLRLLAVRFGVARRPGLQRRQ